MGMTPEQRKGADGVCETVTVGGVRYNKGDEPSSRSKKADKGEEGTKTPRKGRKGRKKAAEEPSSNESATE